MWALTEPRLEADFLFLDEAPGHQPCSGESLRRPAPMPSSSWSVTPPRPSTTGAAPGT
jgi:hypothetical protein